MKLTNPNPITVPPLEEKTFSDLWIYSVSVMAPSTDTGRVTIETLPYNYETKEILGGNASSISTDKLWQAVYEVPEVAQAMGAIFMAIEPLRKWVEAQNAPAVEAEPEIEEEIPALEIN